MLTTQEVAIRLGCTIRWVQILVTRGELQAVRVGRRRLRIPADALAEFIAANTTGTK